VVERGNDVYLIELAISRRRIADRTARGTVPIAFAPRCRLTRQVLRGDLHSDEV
jgi:hypothetical protein